MGGYDPNNMEENPQGLIGEFIFRFSSGSVIRFQGLVIDWLPGKSVDGRLQLGVEITDFTTVTNAVYDAAVASRLQVPKAGNLGRRLEDPIGLEGGRGFAVCLAAGRLIAAL